MEAIASALQEYAVDEAQKSGAFKLSMKPYYRLVLLGIAKKTKFKVASLARQQKGTMINKITREIRKVDDFTPAGKICLVRLQQQIDLRLLAPIPSQCLATLFDPGTQRYVEKCLAAYFIERQWSSSKLSTGRCSR